MFNIVDLFLFISLYVQNKLMEPEMIENVLLSNTGVQSTEMVANPDYISGTTRNLFTF